MSNELKNIDKNLEMQNNIQNNVEVSNNMSMNSESIFRQENNVDFQKLVNFEANDCLGIGKVASLFEKVFSARSIKKNADAVAYAIPTIEKALNNSNLPNNINLNIGGIEIKSVPPVIDERALNNLISREVKKQINSESVLSQALEYVDFKKISEEDIDEDWIDKFFDNSSNISTKELQAIWAKILANEIERPSSYSLRSLDILKNMSKREAEIFKRFISITLSGVNKDYRFSTDNYEILAKYGITFNDILLLQEIGLVQTGLVRNLLEGANAYFIDDIYLLIIKNKSNEKKSFGIINTTSVGTELANIIMELENYINKTYIREFISLIEKSCTIDVEYGRDYKLKDEKISYNIIANL